MDATEDAAGAAQGVDGEEGWIMAEAMQPRRKLLLCGKDVGCGLLKSFLFRGDIDTLYLQR